MDILKGKNAKQLALHVIRIITLTPTKELS